MKFTITLHCIPGENVVHYNIKKVISIFFITNTFNMNSIVSVHDFSVLKAVFQLAQKTGSHFSRKSKLIYLCLGILSKHLAVKPLGTETKVIFSHQPAR